MRVKIICPECGRVLGDTQDSLSANLNCRGCKKTVDVRIKIAKSADYLTRKEEK